jgi:hypothetical protein
LDSKGATVYETPLDPPISGKLSFGATLGGAYNGTVSVTLSCEPSDQAVAQWQSDVFSALSGAVSARETQRKSAQATNRSDRTDTVRTALSASVRRTMIRGELKRQVFECLLGEHFSGFNDATLQKDSNGVNRPLQDFDKAAVHGVLVRFFEQSFEWDNLMHVLYPWYWASSSNWARLVDFERDDTELTTFLEAGGARVLAPARPGFEAAVFSFLELGLVLPGGNVLGGSQTTSMSVADEIMALTRPPADGVPGESWESSVPTALLWLDTKLSLPIQNPNPTLTAPKA